VVQRLRSRLKSIIIRLYCQGVISASLTQRLIDALSLQEA
jgi:hypothetical protein